MEGSDGNQDTIKGLSIAARLHRERYARDLAALSVTMDEETMTAAGRKGKALTLEQAIAEALADTD